MFYHTCSTKTVANLDKYWWGRGDSSSPRLAERQYIFLPWCNENHWKMAVFIGTMEERYLAVLDSLTHKKSISLLNATEKRILLAAWNYLMNLEGRTALARYTAIPEYIPVVRIVASSKPTTYVISLYQVPGQADYANCGLFPAHYLDHFLTNPLIYADLCKVGESHCI